MHYIYYCPKCGFKLYYHKKPDGDGYFYCPECDGDPEDEE